ncbi:ATP-binding protein [Cohnella nanjingensis]|uniref:histidine kinase n=1 Tax=Cohnella nanjingensis TaxID=1387779 RepID=A0A7X0RLQ9_9BACL|nr:ATP-binding protein [Cohnella nanjingensis]MBB6669828.1 PAS domain S-box protein [Cohnella nanjingensis]
MSIKAKLSLYISFLVAIILFLNISITYFSTKSGLEEQALQQTEIIAKQVGASVKSSWRARQFMEEQIGEKLRAAAVAAEAQLDPDIANVTNAQLVALSRKLEVDGITLWKKTDDDIVVQKSSESKEIGLGSKTMDYWYTAFQQLFALKPVTVVQGQKLTHYWSGPINFSTSDPSKINKWGSYYDGSTNYMINPFVHVEVFMDFEKSIGTEGIIAQLLKDNPDILEIAGFDPEFFGKNPIIKIKQGKPVYNLDVRDLKFGHYIYRDVPADKAVIDEAVQTGRMITKSADRNGKRLLKSFIPIAADKNYVIGVSFDRNVIRETLVHQLLVHSFIGLGLLVATVFASYFLAGFLIRPLHQILRKVNAVAGGRFGTSLPIRSKDELGLLASRVNTMSSNLHSYTTRLKDAAEELRSTKQYLESFVNQTSDAIHVADLNGRLMQVNNAFEKMYGWRTEEALGSALHNIPEDLQPEFARILGTVMDGGAVADYETVRYRKDGAPIDVSMTISSIRDEEGAIVAIASISRNITARKQTEEVLRRSEKLSMVGQLAAGVAHEIRNPLTTLRGFVQLQMQTGRSSPQQLQVMLSELDRINLIVSEFLIFSKPQAVHYQLVDVRRIMQETISLIESHALLSNVQIELRTDEDIPPLNCEPNQLKQVFLNVLKNGMEAMPEGGRLQIDIAGEPRLDRVAIRICDDGCGIPEQELGRLGEPFYTSKEAGHGLGLMVSQQILANHKGSIRYESEVGRGTCVEIRLPAYADGLRTPQLPAG